MPKPLRRRLAPAAMMTLALAAVALTGCVTANPRGVFEASRDELAGRHPGEAVWLRLEGDADAAARVREILAAPLSPDAAAEVALYRNPLLQATLEELGIAQAELAQATRLANPGVSFTSIEGGGGRQTTVEVVGDVVDWLLQPLRRRVAAAELERARLEVGQAILDAVAEARRELVAFQAAEQLAARLAQAEEIERAASDYAGVLHAAGNLTALERAAARAESAERRAELERAKAEVARQREAVALALGLSGAETWSAEAGLPPPGDEDLDVAGLDAVALEQAALAARFDLGAGRWAVKVLERALKLQKRTRGLPVGVDLGVETEREADGTRLTGPVVEVRLPIFDTGKAGVARLEAELARARWQLAALEGAARSQVRQAATDVAAARELYRLYRDDVLPLRREVLERTLLEYNQMLIGTFDVLRARQEEIEAEQRAIEALADYWQARYRLERAVAGPLPGAAAAPPAEEPEGDENPPADHHYHHGAAPESGQEDGR